MTAVKIEDTGHEWYDGNLLPLIRDPSKLIIASVVAPEMIVYHHYAVEDWSPVVQGSDRQRAHIGGLLAKLKADEIEAELAEGDDD